MRPSRLRSALCRTLCNRAGTAAIEFVFTAPALVLFLLGIVESGRALWTDSALQYAAEQAGRYALANPTASDAQITSVATGQLPSVDSSRVTVTVTRNSINGVNFLTVNASYPFVVVTSLIPIGPITLTGQTRVPLT
jgi:Flp pilus assembly protein TadG